MTRDDIIRMAREAGIIHPEMVDKTLERFAALVAAHTLSNIDPSSFMSWQEGYAAGAATEREMCARVCDDLGNRLGMGREPDPDDCAAAIRARGETK